MKFDEKGVEGIRKIFTECLALLFILTARRVPSYAKIVVPVPLGYIASPPGPTPDGLLVFGRIDDLIADRLSYILLKILAGPVMAKDCGDRVEIFLSHNKIG